MADGFGRGFGRGGWGIGFRRSSPPWPYVGLGRGGLPRCGYFIDGAGGIPASPGYPSYGGSWATPHYRETPYTGAVPYGYPGVPMGAVPGAYPYAPQMAREQELDFLKSQAEAIKGQLEQINTRIKELETE